MKSQLFKMDSYCIVTNHLPDQVLAPNKCMTGTDMVDRVMFETISTFLRTCLMKWWPSARSLYFPPQNRQLSDSIFL